MKRHGQCYPIPRTVQGMKWCSERRGIRATSAKQLFPLLQFLCLLLYLGEEALLRPEVLDTEKIIKVNVTIVMLSKVRT